jgi:hypothetical protein
MNSFEAQIICFVAGGLLFGALGYFMGYFMAQGKRASVDSDELIDAKIKAANAEAYKDGQESVFRDFSVEQTLYAQTKGKIFKERYMVLEERLSYRGIPLLGWVTHRRKVEEHIDENALKLFAETGSAVLATLVNRQVKIIPSRPR